MIFDSTNSNTCCNLFRWNRLQQFLPCPDPCSIKAITHHEGKLWGPLCNRVSLHINISGSCYKDRNDICKDYVQLSQVVNGYISGYQWLYSVRAGEAVTLWTRRRCWAKNDFTTNIVSGWLMRLLPALLGGSLTFAAATISPILRYLWLLLRLMWVMAVPCSRHCLFHFPTRTI